MATIDVEYKLKKQAEMLDLLLSLLYHKEILSAWEMEKLQELSEARAAERIEK